MHGRYAEDGTVQGMLELLKIPYFGAKVRGSALGMNKIIQKKLLQSHDITVARGITLEPITLHTLQQDATSLEALLKEHHLDFPLVVKPAHEGSSLGVSVVQDKEKLLAACVHAMNIDPHHTQPVLVEERIEGLEFTCIITQDALTDTLVAFAPTEVVHEKNSMFHDYEQKYMPGRALKFTPARCTQEQTQAIQTTCLEVVKILEFGIFGRIDGFLKKDGTVVIVDPNSLAGMAPSSFIFNQAAHAGMNHTQLIHHLIKTELQKTPLYKDFFTTMNYEHIKENKLRVAVIFGGPSNEREVSLDSGRNVCYKLSSYRYQVIPLFMDRQSNIYHISSAQLVHNATAEIEHELDPHKKIKWHQLADIADFVFIALHGSPGEDGIVQGALELLKLPYNGPGIIASALGIDKFKTNELLRQEGFDVPRSTLITRDAWQHNQPAILHEITTHHTFPCIIKPHDDGCSVMVSKISCLAELQAELDTFFKQDKTIAMVEEYISGIELTVGVIGNDTPRALPPSQAVVKKDLLSMEEKFLPGAGENQTPAPLHDDVLERIKRTMEGVFKTLGCVGYSRIDCFYQSPEQSPTGQERIIPLEINTLPALTPATCIFHQAAELGIAPSEFIDLIVELGLQHHKKQPLSAQSARLIEQQQS